MTRNLFFRKPEIGSIWRARHPAPRQTDKMVVRWHRTDGELVIVRTTRGDGSLGSESTYHWRFMMQNFDRAPTKRTLSAQDREARKRETRAHNAH